jgi:RNA polymerase sigma-70 factor, ECF subfamily
VAGGVGQASNASADLALQIWRQDGPLGDVGDARVRQATGLEAVYRTEGPAIWRALVAFAGDAAVAEDSFSEAFAQVLARGDAIRDPARWVWRVAFRIAAGELKDRRRRSGDLGVEVVYNVPESIIDVVDALAQLSPNQRLAVVMHDYADRPVAEVAAALGATRATVYVHLSQARKRLRVLLEDHDA